MSTLARSKLHLGASEIAILYAECALVMLIIQTLFFADSFKSFANRYLLFPAFLMTAGALALFPLTSTLDQLAGVIALMAVSAGVIAPVISYRVSVLADGHQGTSFELQSASSYLGQALGALSSSVLFGFDS